MSFELLQFSLHPLTMRYYSSHIILWRFESTKITFWISCIASHLVLRDLNFVHFECFSHAAESFKIAHIFSAHQPSRVYIFKSFFLRCFNSSETTMSTTSTHQKWDWRLKMFLVRVLLPNSNNWKVSFWGTFCLDRCWYTLNMRKIYDAKFTKTKLTFVTHEKLWLLCWLLVLWAKWKYCLRTFRLFDVSIKIKDEQKSKSINIGGGGSRSSVSNLTFCEFDAINWVRNCDRPWNEFKRAEAALRQIIKLFRFSPLFYFLSLHFSHITSSCKVESNYWKFFKFYVVFCV